MKTILALFLTIFTMIQVTATDKPSIRPAFRQSDHPTILPSHHQSDSLPPLEVLHQSIDSFHAAQAELKLLELKESKKGEWLKFLPNIGITYSIDGQPRPGISLSSAIFHQTRKAKQQRTAKRESILQTALADAEKTKSELAAQLLRYQFLKENIAAQRERHQVEREIFLIRQDEYERLERSPAEYLQAKRTYLLQQEALRSLERQLATLELEILQLAYFPQLLSSGSSTFQK